MQLWCALCLGLNYIYVSVCVCAYVNTRVCLCMYVCDLIVNINVRLVIIV